MTLRVGQKVVCVDASQSNAPGATDIPISNWLSVGTVYTIRWIGDCPYEPWRFLGVHIRLEEVRREDHAIRPEWSDMPFRASRFRPLIERKTDISFAHEILRKVSGRVEA